MAAIEDKPLPVPESMDEEVTSPDEIGREQDVEGNGKVLKTVSRLGTGHETPESGDSVEVHYIGTLLDGTPFDSSRDRGEPFTFVLGQGQVIKGWDVGVATMRKGERAKFVLAPDYAYGSAGSPPKIPGDSTLVFDVELLSWKSVRDLSGDGQLIKHDIREGEGWGSPQPKDEVIVRVQARVWSPESAAAGDDGKGEPDAATWRPFYSSPGAGSTADLGSGATEGSLDATPPVGDTLPKMGSGGSGRVPLTPAALALVLRTMKKGGRARLRVGPAYHAYGPAGEASLGVPADATLDVLFELVAWNKVEDVSEDGRVPKKTIVDSEEWKKPNIGSQLVAEVAVFLTAGGEAGGEGGASLLGREVWRTPAGRPLRWVADDLAAAPPAVTEGLDLACQKMKKGEVAEVVVPAEYAYGDEGVDVEGEAAAGALGDGAGDDAPAPSAPRLTVPPSASLTYRVRLVDFTSARDTWDLNEGEKLDAAEASKARGAAAFKVGRVARAARCWARSEELIKYDESFSDEGKARSRDLKRGILGNLALAHLKRGDARASAEASDQALALDPDGAKPLYRRAQAALALEDWADAEMYIRRGLAGDRSAATLRDFRALLKRWKALSAATAKKEAKLYGAMFKALGKPAAEPAAEPAPEPAAEAPAGAPEPAAEAPAGAPEPAAA